ncbi:hypothetical protein EZS27_022225 [termite gut metagenome]|uniref:RloB domain-containing protein n=1 Tax=termite gut metagenome TaxID=433724 RepID=A0A5J4R5H1_9ZZZZ
MGGRKQKIREPKSGIYIIGEGITEQYYFLHLKNLFGFHCTIKPRFFGNTSIVEMKKKIEELLREDVCVVCVFDADVYVWNESERKKLEQLQNKYKKNKNLLICNSLPSIEFWFLLHYVNTNRHFKDAKDAEIALRKHIQEYSKTTVFLEKEKWVKDLCSEGKMELAMERAKKCTKDDGSYTNMDEALKLLMNMI